MTQSPDRPAPTNLEVARTFDKVASLLETQDANPFRVASYRAASRVIRSLERPLSEIFAESGREGLEQLPGIGSSLAAALAGILETRRYPLLDRLEGHQPAERLFASIPGIGDALAQRVHTMLKVETLEELEAAAHDGRLGRVPGFGKRRVGAVRDVLAGRLSYAAKRHAAAFPSVTTAPSVATLLHVDREYRERGEKGELRRIAPRRFNPRREAWLPILHAERDGWAFTALYSNTARAHELGATHDWVVVFYERDGYEDQCTVVTEPRGLLAGKRVVRGRERECLAHYEGRASRAS